MSPYELYTSLVAKSKVMNYNYIELGRVLKGLKDGDKWLEATGGIDTWQSFVKQPEVGLSVKEAETLITIYTVFVEDFGYDVDYLSGISIKNLKLLLKLSHDVDLRSSDPNIEELLEQAKMLSDRDFKEAIIEKDMALGEMSRTYTYSIMQKCNETGTMRKVHGISSQLVKDTFYEHIRDIDV